MDRVLVQAVFHETAGIWTIVVVKLGCSLYPDYHVDYHRFLRGVVLQKIQLIRKAVKLNSFKVTTDNRESKLILGTCRSLPCPALLQ